MSSLTPIPEPDTYAIAILALNCFGAFFLSLYIFQILPDRWRPDIWHLYGVILGIIALCGLLVVDARTLFGGSTPMLVGAAALGIAAGWAASWLDRLILRWLARRDIGAKRNTPRSGVAGRPSTIASGAVRVTRYVVGSPKGPIEGRSWSSRPDMQMRSRSLLKPRIDLPTTIAIAALEEILFRGFLIQLSLMLPTQALIAAGIASSVALFSCNHIWHGWAHVAAKTPLGVFAAMTVLITETLVPAIIAHVLFNTRVWADQRNSRVVNGDDTTA